MVEADYDRVLADNVRAFAEDYVRVHEHLCLRASLQLYQGQPADVPALVNNEIRNALNHLTRMIRPDQRFGDEEPRGPQAEVWNAHWHLSLAKEYTLIDIIEALRGVVAGLTSDLNQTERAPVDEALAEYQATYVEISQEIVAHGMQNATADVGMALIAELEGLAFSYLKLFSRLKGASLNLGDAAPIVRPLRHPEPTRPRQTLEWVPRRFGIALGIQGIVLLLLAVGLCAYSGSIRGGLMGGWPLLLIIAIAGLPPVIMAGARTRQP
jgi:hypothetical protein